MPSGSLAEEIRRRRTFAIISHPDAGKTTLTEKLLLFGGAIQMAGTVKGRKATRHATSDWMRLEQQRGISVTSSVMQFPFEGCVVNLLDTPGHEDFSEDTYRTLTAVDSALMVIDCAKGVEERTIKLMEVTRLRDTPIMTFVNKLDRDGRAPIELLDEIESVLKIQCAPITWPIGMGRDLLGVYHLIEDKIYVYVPVEKGRVGTHETIDGLASDAAREFLKRSLPALPRGGRAGARRKSRSSIWHAIWPRNKLPCSSVRPSTISASANCCRAFVAHSPPPQPRPTLQRPVDAEEDKLSGFVFKIQANMDPGHRDRIAFMRLCSGRYARGMRLASCAPRQGRAHCGCAHLPRRRSQPSRGGLCRRYHRLAQSRQHQHWRQLQRRREPHLHRRPQLCAGNLQARSAQGSVAHEGPAKGLVATYARRAPRSCSSRCATTI